MGDTKFEKLARKKLKNREIQPSDNSWNRLEAQLGTIDRRKSFVFGSRKWSAAASIILLVGLSTWFYVFTGESIETRFDAPGEFTNLPLLKKTEEKSGEGLVDGISGEKTKTIRKTNNANKSRIVNTDQGQMIPKEAVLNESRNTLSMLPDTATQKIAIPIRVAALEKQKQPDSLFAIENSIVTNSKAVQEAEMLLAEAKQQLYNQDTTKQVKSADPIVLLDEAESELDQTFKEQVFEALKSSYKKVRTAMKE